MQITNLRVPILRILCSIGSSNGIKRGKSSFAMGPLGTLHASAIGDQGNNGVTVSGLDARGLDPRLLARKDNSCPKSHQYTACRSPIAALKGRPSSFLAVCLRAKGDEVPSSTFWALEALVVSGA